MPERTTPYQYPARGVVEGVVARSRGYEEVYLHAYDSVAEAHHGLARYFTFCNSGRAHGALDGRTPDMVYFGTPPQQKAA